MIALTKIQTEEVFHIIIHRGAVDMEWVLKSKARADRIWDLWRRDIIDIRPRKYPKVAILVKKAGWVRHDDGYPGKPWESICPWIRDWGLADATAP